MKFTRLGVVLATLAFLAVGQVIWWAFLLISQQRELGTGQENHFNRMVLAEGIFFVAVWSIGMWLAYRSHRQQLWLQKSQNDFLSAITHELKTPITNARLVFDTLERPDLSPEQKAMYLKRGQMAVDKLSSEVDLILAISHSNSAPMIKETFALKPFLRDIVEESTLFESRVSLQMQEELLVHTVPDDLKIIFKSLLSNALKYSSKKTTSDSSDLSDSKEVVVTCARQNSSIAIEITDPGIGMTEEEIKFAFKAFWRSDRSIKSATPGTGLGLTLVNNLATRSGIDIELKSQGLNQGTTAVIRLNEAKYE
jgi:signal transduction histidine kinase